MTRFPDALAADHLLDVHIALETPPERVGAGPLGNRSVHIIKSGTFEGPKLRGTIRAGGGDWLLTFADYNELDVRATMQTDDGALIYLSYRGVLKVDPAIIERVFAGDDVDSASYYFRTTPRFETGHEKYAWLNSLVCAGYGVFGAGTVSYRVFGIT